MIANDLSAHMNKNDISLEQIVLGWNPVFEKSKLNPLACIELIDERQYATLREQVNNAFQIDGIGEFTGVVEEETEFGDVTDVMIIMLQEKYPPEEYGPKSSSTMLSVEARKAWRDELIKELDEMVER